MNILFLCISLEPGKDGVGDYTLKIASELYNRGYCPSILSFSDKYTDVPAYGNLQNRIETLRLPHSLSYKKRRDESNRWIEKQNPDVISIQYVPYGFQKKGLPFRLPGIVNDIKKDRRVHIMFHELWQGESKQSTLKEKMIGFLQKRIAKKLFSHSSFDIAFTNAAFYGICLKREGIPTEVLPVFSNLPLPSGNASLYNQLPFTIRQERGKYIIACFFGAIHFHPRLKEKVSHLAELIKNISKKLLVVQIGRATVLPEVRDIFASAQIELICLGEQDAFLIPDFFVHADVGLSTYPKILYQKSGSMAALLNNGLPVIVLNDGFENDSRQINEIKETEEIVSIRDFIYQPKDFSAQYSVDHTVSRYISLLTSI